MTQPPSPSGVVYDLGYQPHEGPRLGRRGAVAAVFKDGIRRVLGIRRKARRKVLPFLLLGIAVVPAAVLVGLSFLLQGFDPTEADIFGHGPYFDITATMALLFCALAAPELMIPDRVEGVLSIYASRPLRGSDYLLARAGALATVVLGFLVIPQLVLYVGLAAISDEGFLSALVENAADLVKISLGALVFFVAYSAPAFAISGLSKRVATAAGTYLAVMLGSNILALFLTEGAAFDGARYGALIGLENLPRHVRDWIFDLPSEAIAADASFAAWTSLIVIVVVSLIAAAATVRRYRNEL